MRRAARYVRSRSPRDHPRRCNALRSAEARLCGTAEAGCGTAFRGHTPARGLLFSELVMEKPRRPKPAGQVQGFPWGGDRYHAALSVHRHLPFGIAKRLMQARGRLRTANRGHRQQVPETPKVPSSEPNETRGAQRRETPENFLTFHGHVPHLGDASAVQQITLSALDPFDRGGRHANHSAPAPPNLVRKSKPNGS